MTGTVSPLSCPWPDQLGGGHDKYTRTLADVLLLDGTNVNQTLVEDGWCWWYRKYAPDDTVLEGLEKEAREVKKGLWADPAPIPPWVYRKARRGQSLDLSDLVPSTGLLEEGKK
jgi:micrococcal nuclease